MLKDKWVLITGASSGIGRESVELFAKNGAKLLLLARDIEKLQSLQSIGAESYIFSVDVSDYEEVKKCFMQIRKITKSIDVLVNNAGILESAMFMMTNQKTIQNVFEVNTFSQMYVSQFVSKMMIKQKKGSIINVTSIMGISGANAHTIYSASKAAIIGFTKSLAKELAPIRVNAIAPGIVDTPLLDSISDEKKNEFIQKIPLKRLALPQEIAQSILFLASDMSSYITASVLEVDGGLCSI